jgi:hypothetical protein
MEKRKLQLLFVQFSLLLSFLMADQTAFLFSQSDRGDKLLYINTHIENASPLNWHIDEKGNVILSLIYDYERFSPNRAAGHWHFLIEASTGSEFTLILQNFHNIWNGRPGSPIKDNTACYISNDGKVWSHIHTDKIEDSRLKIRIRMENDSLFVARLQPYRIRELNKLLSDIKDHPLVKIWPIGQTVQKRKLNVIQIGSEEVPHRILLRGRAHPWEAGTNWLLHGLIESILNEDAQNTEYLKGYCLYILPMINMDGVAMGKTRFNLNGKDLNRNWDKMADPHLAPENYALERFLQRLIENGHKPDLAIDFHNDEGGRLHISRPEMESEAYLKRMGKLEKLLRKYTWFTEGSTGKSFRNPGTFGEGLLERYKIDALIFELNANWIAGLNKVPSADDWQTLGKDLRKVFFEYFND